MMMIRTKIKMIMTNILISSWPSSSPKVRNWSNLPSLRIYADPIDQSPSACFNNIMVKVITEVSLNARRKTRLDKNRIRLELMMETLGFDRLTKRFLQEKKKKKKNILKVKMASL